MADNGIRQAVKVSVCIPCYNAEKTLRQAIDSALKQDVDVEIIAVNDCSTDGTGKILEEYCCDSRVRVLTNTENLGASGSRNRAVAEAKGHYVAYLDADDMWDERKLSRQIRLLEQTGHCLCCTGRELMTPEGRLTGRTIGVKSRITYRDLLKMNSINCSSVVMPTKLARQFPMAHEDGHEDYITWLKLLRKMGPADGINEPLLKYRLSSSGKSGSKLHSARMTFRSYRYAGIGPLRSLFCFASYAFLGTGKYLGAHLKGAIHHGLRDHGKSNLTKKKER